METEEKKSMKDYIEQALTTEAPISLDLLERMRIEARAVHAFFGLLTEIGELADAFKRHIFYGKDLDLTNVDEEIGDVLWYLAILMNHCNVDFESCMTRNIAKLRARYPNKFSEYDAVHRNLEAERAILEKPEVTVEDFERATGFEVLSVRPAPVGIPSPKGAVRCPFCFQNIFVVPKVMNQHCSSCNQLMEITFLPDGSAAGASKS